MDARCAHVRARIWVAAGLMLGLTAHPALAQETGTVQGLVVDATSLDPLVGVQVFVPGTSIGTITNADGRYLLINVPAGEYELRVQLIGYQVVDRTIQVQADETVTANFELDPSAIALDEIVVTGAGVAMEKKRLGNVIATVDASELEAAPIQNISEMLQGRVAGVVGMPSGGLVGEGAQIRIRGTASITQSSEPIVYVDGVRVDAAGGFAEGVTAGGGGTPSRLDDINPAAIERIEILKGAAAATLYGTEASNGVIQIFTKDGYRGEPQWTFELNQGILKYPGNRFKPNVGFALDEAPTAPNTNPLRPGGDVGSDNLSVFAGRPVEPFELVSVPLVERLFETGTATEFAGSISGGNDLVTYYLNGRYQTVDGPLGGENLGPMRDQFTRKQAALTVSVFPTQKLSLRASAMYNDTHQEVPNGRNNIYGTVSLAMFGKPEHAYCNDPSTAVSEFHCRTEEGDIAPGNPTGQAAFMTLRESYYTEVVDEVQHFTSSLNASYQLLPSIVLDATLGLDLVNQRSFEFSPYGHNVDDYSTGYYSFGRKDLGERNHTEVSFDGRAAWQTDFGADISSSFVVGTQIFYEQTKTAGGFAYDFPAPGIEVISAAAVREEIKEIFLSVVNAGVFAQEQIGWRDFAFLTLGGRYDVNSAFGEATAGAFYPKASVSIIPSDRSGWSDPLGISTLRLRSAIGQAGLQPGAFSKLTTYEALATSFGAGLQPSNLGNQELRPEVSTEWELGTELGFFDDRLGLTVTYWDRTVSDLLVPRQFPVTGGFINKQLVNIAEMKAHGWELAVTGLAYNSEDVSISLFANGAYLAQEVTDMGGAPPLKVGDSYPRYRNFIREGYTPGALFGARLVDVPEGSVAYDTNGDGEPDTEAQLAAYFESNGPTNPGVLADNYLMLADVDADGNVLDHFQGKPFPDWKGSLGAEITWGDFRFSSLFEYKARNYTVTNLTDAFRQSNAVIGRNTPLAARVEATMLNPASTPEDRVEAAKLWATELQALSPYSGLNTMEVGNFLRWREASLTYFAPPELAARVGASSLALTVTGRNLQLFTNYTGIDPEMNVFSRGAEESYDQNFGVAIDAFGLPLPRRFSFNIRVGF